MGARPAQSPFYGPPASPGVEIAIDRGIDKKSKEILTPIIKQEQDLIRSDNVSSTNEADTNIDQERVKTGKNLIKVFFGTLCHTFTRVVKTKGSKSLPAGSAAFQIAIRSSLSRKHGWNVVSDSLSATNLE
jgi:hypothetical protein